MVPSTSRGRPVIQDTAGRERVLAMARCGLCHIPLPQQCRGRDEEEGQVSDQHEDACSAPIAGGVERPNAGEVNDCSSALAFCPSNQSAIHCRCRR